MHCRWGLSRWHTGAAERQKAKRFPSTVLWFCWPHHWESARQASGVPALGAGPTLKWGRSAAYHHRVCATAPDGGAAGAGSVDSRHRFARTGKPPGVHCGEPTPCSPALSISHHSTLKSSRIKPRLANTVLPARICDSPARRAGNIDPLGMRRGQNAGAHTRPACSGQRNHGTKLTVLLGHRPGRV